MKFELKVTDLSSLESYLKKNEVIKTEEKITHLATAGEGNMNLTLRADLSERSLIVKQANPFVQKYPSIAAPVERAEMEYTFFTEAKSIKKIAHYLPRAIFYDGENHIQVIEDLGRQGDYSKYYSPDLKFPPRLTHHLVEFLQLLHTSTQKSSAVSNFKMRELNHQHIFDIPFNPTSGLNLDETQKGLQALAKKYVLNNPELRKTATELGDIYLSVKGPALLHGDFFPGSWLDTEKGVKIIDPEFCFSGPVEFELGVFKAHLIFCGMSNRGINTILRRYGDYDKLRADQFAGIEILRRLFGVAQLPLSRTISEKEELTQTALNLLNL
ncbi:phosphotransferase [Cryomorphaceae bacterium 1068]|nr:phosphotransferase [Cryomorphaceae bacterium 1068]